MSKPEKTYRYYVEGHDANNEPWRITGYVDALPAEIFHKVPQVIEAEVFVKLTGGFAVFGKPGLMCKGPYTINEIMIKLRTDWESDKGFTE